jgi:hypothetical protein
MVTIYHLYIKGYNKYYSFDREHLNEIIYGKSYHDILFIGSSRTMHQVNPKLVDSITQLDSYNAGIEAANLLEMNLILECYLKNHKPPKLLVADLAISCFAIKRLPFFNPNLYYQYLDNENVYKALTPYKHVSLLKYFPFLQLTEANDLLKQNAILGYLKKKDPSTKVFYKGYADYGTDTLADPSHRKDISNYPIDNEGIAFLKNIVRICQQKKIDLVFTYAPEYNPDNHLYNPNFFPTISNLCVTCNIPFWDFRNEKICNNHRLFIGEHHLNHFGAEIYSKIIAGYIKRIEESTKETAYN